MHHLLCPHSPKFSLRYVIPGKAYLLYMISTTFLGNLWEKIEISPIVTFDQYSAINAGLLDQYSDIIAGFLEKEAILQGMF